VIRLKTTFALIVFLLLAGRAQATTIRFSDDVTPDSMNSLVAKVAKAYAAGDRNITVELDSGGGNLGSALYANAQLKRYSVNTLVRNECASSCTVLFAAGKTRTASGGANFMFHAVQVEHIDGKLKKQGLTARSVAQDYANRWLAAVRAASPTLAARLEARRTLIAGSDTNYSGSELRKYGYVNN
jgi:hypothetical protein